MEAIEQRARDIRHDEKTELSAKIGRALTRDHIREIVQVHIDKPMRSMELSKFILAKTLEKIEGQRIDPEQALYATDHKAHRQTILDYLKKLANKKEINRGDGGRTTQGHKISTYWRKEKERKA